MLAVGLDVSDVFSNLSVSVILPQEHGVLETSLDMLQIGTAGMILLGSAKCQQCQSYTLSSEPLPPCPSMGGISQPLQYFDT